VNYGERLNRVRRAMEQEGIDLLFLPRPANMYYLTGSSASARTTQRELSWWLGTWHN